jgi:hypothetical protein
VRTGRTGVWTVLITQSTQLAVSKFSLEAGFRQQKSGEK